MSSDLLSYKEWLDFLEYNPSESNFKLYKFAILWISFNSYCNKLKGKREWDKIENFARTYEEFFNKTKKEHTFSSLLDKFNLTNKKENRESVLNMKDKNTKRYFKGSKDSCINYFSVMYQIRCNFIHGEKLPHDEEDTKLLEWAYDSFEYFWMEFIKNEGRLQKN